MAATDFTAFLSPQDKAKLARQVGIPIGDGRVFKRGVIVSAQDTANTLAEQARQGALASQTGQFALPAGSVNADQAARSAYSSYMQGTQAQPSAQFMPQPGAQQAPAAPAGIQPAPSALMLAQAQQIQRFQQSPQFAAQPPAMPQNTGIAAAAGPNISTNTGLPQGSIGFQSGGQFVVQSPMGPGMGTQTFANEGAARTALAGAPSFAPAPTGPVNAPTGAPSASFLPQAAPTLAQRTYTPQEIQRMTPEQLMARNQFDQQNAQAAAAQDAAKLEADKTKASIAKTQAETDALGQPKPAVYTNEADARKAGEAANPGFAVKVEPTAGGFTYSAVQKQQPVIREPFEQLDVQNFDEFTKQSASAIDAAKNAQRTLNVLESDKVEAGILARPYELFNRLASGFSADSNERAVLQTIARQGLTQNTLGGFRTFMGGLGALSNMEGERVERALPSISDPKDSTRFALNVVVLAGEEARKQRELATNLRKQGATPFEVNNAIQDARDKQDVTRAAWKKTFGDKPYPGDESAQQADSAQSIPAQAVKLSPAALKYVK